MSGPAAIPPEAVQAAAAALRRAALLNNAGYIEGDEEAAAWVALEAAEAVWPHGPPKRDPASTTSLVTGRSWTAARQARGTAFGFRKDVSL